MNHLQNRRRMSNVALAVVLGLALVGLSQCRLVDDGVTGVDLQTSGVNAKSSCVKACNSDNKAAKKLEDARHKDAKKACGSDKACKKAEDKRHKDTKDRIDDQKKDCKRGCYNEGSGHGGR